MTVFFADWSSITSLVVLIVVSSALGVKCFYFDKKKKNEFSLEDNFSLPASSENAIKELEKERKTLKNLVINLKTKITSLEGQDKDSKEKIQSQKQKLFELGKQSKELEKQLLELQAKRNSEKYLYRQEKELLEKNLSDLKGQLKETEENLVQLEKKSLHFESSEKEPKRKKKN